MKWLNFKMVFLLCTCLLNLTESVKYETLEDEYNDLFKPLNERSQGRGFSPSVKLPNEMDKILKLAPKKGMFNSFSPTHMEAVQTIQAILSAIEDRGEAIRMSQALRDKGGMNLRAWYSAFIGYSYYDPILLSIQKPDPVNIMPDCFINSKTIDEAYVEWMRPQDQRQCPLVDGSVGADNGIENNLWYFREDIWVNTHHWYFHLAHPTVTKHRNDRRGELFYYTHHEILARYNAERLSNGFSRVVAFRFYKGARIIEGYNAHLRDESANKYITDRLPNRVFADAIHEKDPSFGFNVYAQKTLNVKNIIYRAINNGFLYAKNNSRISINHARGVDILGDVIEANSFSVNQGLYLNYGIHAAGHIISSLIEDPNFLLNLPPGVLADAATSMRDPYFYRWHQLIENMFIQHKNKLRPYEPRGVEFPLLFSGVSISNLKVYSNNTNNELKTFMNQRKFPIGRGLDFEREMNNYTGDVNVCINHLDHDDFTYNFDVETIGFVRDPFVMIRIYMAPRFREDGQRFTMSEQHRLFFALDIFKINLKLGKNSITRASKHSTLTNPFRSVYENQNSKKRVVPFCGCGWPHHMLIPKGSSNGMAFDLFVMITDANKDSVKDNLPRNFKTGCRAAPIICGIPNRLYPLAQPMGYPFDRQPYTKFDGVVSDLDDYINGIPNMATAQVQIQHVERNSGN